MKQVLESGGLNNMTLREYIQSLEDFIKYNPESENYLVVYSEDDEGNRFYPVYFSPTLGSYNKEDKEFISYDAIEEQVELGERDKDDRPQLNAVCIN